MSVRAGIDRLLEEDHFDRERRFALVTNDGACSASYVPSRLALVAKGYRIAKLFSPEHGLMAVAADGCRVRDGYDSLTNLPVKSLYGDILRPSESDLSDIDAVLVDLPDVGCRCYTYLWTLTYVMEACASFGKELILLDRPNPISGTISLAEGPILDESHCSSFIGRWALPLRHSCTLGELARFWAATRVKDLKLHVVEAAGWERDMLYHDWSTSFVPTSPGITTFEACLLYPGLCLSEATNLSEGRGTGMAFRVLGAPWLNGRKVADEFNLVGLQGVIARPVNFMPESGKYKGIGCNGIMLHATCMRQIRPVATGLVLIKLIHDLHPENFTWSMYPTYVNPNGDKHLEKLLGIADAEAILEHRWSTPMGPVPELVECAGWETQMMPYLLYR